VRPTTDLGPPELALDSVVVERGDVRLHMVRSTVSDPHERRAPVLFLHGFPDSHATWSRQLEGLASMHPVAAFDQRGVGDSSAPRDPDGYQLVRHLDDIDAVIDELVGPEGKVHLVGHDWGAMLGWFFAGDRARARRLCSFTAIAGPHLVAMRTLLRDRLLRHRIADLALLADQLRRSWYIFFFQIPRLAELYLTRDPVSMWIRIHRAGGVRRDDPELQTIDERLARSTLIPPLALYRQLLRGTFEAPRAVAVPVCLIVPLRDMALTPELYDKVPEFVPDLEQHRIDDNHWVHRSRAAEVNQILHDFISRHEPDHPR